METGLNRRETFSFGAIPSLNIPDLTKSRKDLPLPNSQIGALELSLYGTIIHAALTLLAYFFFSFFVGDTSVFLRMKEMELVLSYNISGRGEILNFNGLRQMGSSGID